MKPEVWDWVCVPLSCTMIEQQDGGGGAEDP